MFRNLLYLFDWECVGFDRVIIKSRMGRVCGLSGGLGDLNRVEIGLMGYVGWVFGVKRKFNFGLG